MRLLTAFALSLTMMGCGRKVSPNGDPNLIKAEVKPAVEKIHELGNRLGTFHDCVGRLPILFEVRRMISQIEDASDRLSVLSYLMDYLYSLDLSGQRYRIQYCSQLAIRYLVGDGALSDLHPGFGIRGRDRDACDGYMEWRYDGFLKQLAWEREWVVRTVPKYRVEHHGFELDPVKKEEYENWWCIHYGGISRYESLLRDVERWFWRDRKEMSDAAWDRCKARIEAYLGRPLRTPEQLLEDAKNKRHVEFHEEEDDRAIAVVTARRCLWYNTAQMDFDTIVKLAL